MRAKAIVRRLEKFGKGRANVTIVNSDSPLTYMEMNGSIYCLASLRPIFSSLMVSTGFPLNDTGSGNKLPLSEIQH